MPKRKLLHDDINRRAAIKNMVGGRLHLASCRFFKWSEQTPCERPFRERVYAAAMFTGDIDLAIAIAERTTGIREAGREAKAVAALKEIAHDSVRFTE
jgi:hypothetical protein